MKAADDDQRTLQFFVREKSSDIYTIPIQVEEGLDTTNQRWIGWLWTKIFSSRKSYSQGFLPLARLVSLPG